LISKADDRIRRNPTAEAGRAQRIFRRSATAEGFQTRSGPDDRWKSSFDKGRDKELCRTEPKSGSFLSQEIAEVAENQVFGLLSGKKTASPRR
jgi:hypothetical protein